MKRIVSLAIVMLAAPALAGAVELRTGFMNAGAGQRIQCALMNETDGGYDVKIEVVDVDGNGLPSDSHFPAGSRGWVNFREGADGVGGSCRFIVPGSRKNWKGTACVYQLGGCRAALDAR